MKRSALGSVFIFRGRSIGLDNYKSKESLSRVVVTVIREKNGADILEKPMEIIM